MAIMGDRQREHATASRFEGGPTKLKDQSIALSVAPMMDWTDRHCRYFHRQFSRHTRLYTEMIPAQALVHGAAPRLLEFNPAEHPVALQLGGSCPDQLAEATRMGCEAGYDEINLNVGCPSGRVKEGGFGACLMAIPDHVARCLESMQSAASGKPVTVKCRIGIDDQDPQEVLPAFIATVAASGVTTVAIHARKALLNGLSPRDNRRIPPLDHGLVLRMKERFRHLSIIINGGLMTLDDAMQHLASGIDGTMFGRAAYNDPSSILGQADRRIFKQTDSDVSPREAILAMIPYIESEMSRGQRLHAITRHMMGAFAGRPGAKYWRRLLSTVTQSKASGPEFIASALQEIDALTH